MSYILVPIQELVSALTHDHMTLHNVTPPTSNTSMEDVLFSQTIYLPAPYTILLQTGFQSHKGLRVYHWHEEALSSTTPKGEGAPDQKAQVQGTCWAE